MLQLDKFEGTALKSDNFVFKFQPKKYPNKALLVPNLRHFSFFCETFQLDQFEGADLKYDNSFFEILGQKYQHEAFLVPNLGIFIISQNFAIRQIRGC